MERNAICAHRLRQKRRALRPRRPIAPLRASAVWAVVLMLLFSHLYVGAVALAEGEASISAKAIEGLPLSMGLYPGEAVRLTPSVVPSEPTDKLIYGTDNEQVVSVDSSGLVTGVGEGYATVRVRCGRISRIIAITVSTPTEPIAEQRWALVPMATPAPHPTPEYFFSVEATDETTPERLGISDTVYYGSPEVTGFRRPAPDSISMPFSATYADWPGGVMTFRNGPFRQNASFGSANISTDRMKVAWSVPVGSMDDTHGWTGQPVIVKWAKEMREMMNIFDAKKRTSALREVIFAGPDGNVYFLDLDTGEPTRNVISLDPPLKASVSLFPSAIRPILAVGQAEGSPGKETGHIGMVLYSLLDQTPLLFVNGRNENALWPIGGFHGTALFDRGSDQMIVAGDNGLLYTVNLNTQFDYTAQTLVIKPGPDVTLASKADGNNNAPGGGSVAMYGSYTYYADRNGLLRCVDANAMGTVWAADTGENTDATIALSPEPDGSVALYMASTLTHGKEGISTLRRLDALSGTELWQFTQACTYDTAEQGGVMASPLVGENSISHLVIFTIPKTEEGGAIVALDKESGTEIWRQSLPAYACSSPVAVYDKDGRAWVIQGDSGGVLHMLDGQTGAVLSSLQLDGAIDTSPAVYMDMLVVGTSSKDISKIYGIWLD